MSPMDPNISVHVVRSVSRSLRGAMAIGLVMAMDSNIPRVDLVEDLPHPKTWQKKRTRGEAPLPPWLRQGERQRWAGGR